MRLIGVSMVKNEADIIEVFVRHNLQYLDHLIVLDHDSADETPRILKQLLSEGLPLTLTTITSPAFEQASHLSKMARTLFVEQGADYVLPLDADEFIRTPSRQALEYALRETGGMVALAEWQTYVVAEEHIDEVHPFLRMPLRVEVESARPNLHKVFLSKQLMQLDNWQLSPGNHAVGTRNADSWSVVQSTPLSGIQLAHLPLRSAPQVAAKAIIGWLSWHLVFGRQQQARHFSWHWKSLYEHVLKGQDIDAKLLQRFAAFAYALDCPPNDPQANAHRWKLLHDPLQVTTTIRYAQMHQATPLTLVTAWATQLVDTLLAAPARNP